MFYRNSYFSSNYLIKKCVCVFLKISQCFGRRIYRDLDFKKYVLSEEKSSKDALVIRHRLISTSPDPQCCQKPPRVLRRSQEGPGLPHRAAEAITKTCKKLSKNYEILSKLTRTVYQNRWFVHIKKIWNYIIIGSAFIEGQNQSISYVFCCPRRFRALGLMTFLDWTQDV